MQENILTKARKLLALINHPNTQENEKQAATWALDQLCQKHKITAESADHGVYINKLAKIIITELTHAEYLAVTDMLTHYRREHRKITAAIDAQTKELKAQTKKELDRLQRIKKKAMIGLIEANKIYAEPDSESEPNKKSRSLPKQELDDLISAYHLAKGTAYQKPAPNLTTQHTVH